MKLNYLSAAVTTAIAMTLTACGGSDDNNVSYTTPTQNNIDKAPALSSTGATSTTGTTTTGANSSTGTTTVSGGQQLGENKLIQGIDISAKPTVVGQSYNRNKEANFDYIANDDAANKSMPVVLGSKTLQDKDMKNIVLGAEAYTTDASGNPIKDASGNTIVQVSVNRYAGKVEGDENLNKEYDTVGYNKAPKHITVDNRSLQERNTNTAITAANVYTAKPADTAGLFYQGAKADAGTQTTYDNSKVETSEDTSNIRIFGAKYKDIANVTPVNSYRGIGTIDAKTGLMTYTTASKFDNIRLENVQYGRVSSNIDALAADKIGSQIKAGQQIVGTEARAFNAPDAVNTYFYRGINESTLAQMGALDQKGVFNYYGHALTYGLNGNVTANAGLDSNSIGASQEVKTLGDFVKATYDVANKQVTGDIYNVKFTNNAGGVENPLINFNGKVTGNTVIGTSTNVLNKENGALKASFYGDQAQELGGAVNSINVDKYGTSTWGGVFGAKRDIYVAPPVQKGNGNIAQIEK